MTHKPVSNKKAVPLLWGTPTGIINVKYMSDTDIHFAVQRLKKQLVRPVEPKYYGRSTSEWLQVFAEVRTHRNICVNKLLSKLPKALKVLSVIN
jgi:hypothetical protein